MSSDASFKHTTCSKVRDSYYMDVLLQSLSFGLIIVLILLGLIGIIIPLLPGTFLIWLAVLLYVLGNGMEVIGWGSFIFITIIALGTGTSDWWMALLGAKTGGASGRSILFGIGGAIIGSFIFPLIGTIIGYAAGIIFSEYQKAGDWDAAIKASVGGLAGWGLATAVQLGGGILMLIIFVYKVLTA